jgi:hypothetical protein
VLLLAFLVLIGSLSCCKSYVRAHVPRCPKISEVMIMEMMTVTGSPTVDYVADELIPYCVGIDALLDE